MAGRTGDSIPLREPKFLCSDERAVVSFVTLQAAGGGGGEGYSGDTATITARTVESRVRHSPPRDSPIAATGVEVEIDTAYEEAWTDFLVESGGWTQIGTNTYRCEPPSGGPMPVIVRQTVVGVSLSR
jgi:hypothetical protein